MSAWTHARWSSFGVLAFLGVLAGCSADAGSGGGMVMAGPSYAGSSSGSSSGTASSSSGSGGGSSQPMLVVVDTNRTMSANAGDGVGVFTEYQTGGHWHVWWTCDTNKTNLPCSFDVTVSVSTGTITSLAGQTQDSGDSVTQASGTSVEATTTTTANVDGITFDTAVTSGTTPIITLDAKLDGSEDGSFLFFVQDGIVNGGYGGTLSDPLMLEPSVP